jgi:hypothetical protein
VHDGNVKPRIFEVLGQLDNRYRDGLRLNTRTTDACITWCAVGQLHQHPDDESSGGCNKFPQHGMNGAKARMGCIMLWTEVPYMCVYASIAHVCGAVCG